MVASVVAGAAGVLVLPLVAVSVFFGSGAADPPRSGTVVCAAATDEAGGPSESPGTTQLGRDQVANARVILNAAGALGLPRQAAIVALMAAYQESKLLVLANPAVPESTSRPRPAWRAAQAVQASADGTGYEQWEPLARGIADALASSGAGALRCSADVELVGPGGDFSPEQCSVRPDPTTGRGCLTPRTLNLANQLVAAGWRVSCWDAHEWNPDSDHPLGKACDVFPGRGGVLPSNAERAAGDALAASLQASAGRTGVAYLIWYGRQWSSARANEGWRPYGGGGVYDPGSVVGGHFDHIHISIA